MFVCQKFFSILNTILNMTQKQIQLLDLILKSEGNYCNVTGDAGGETYQGISRTNFPNWEGWEIIDSIPDKKYNQKFDNEDLKTQVYNFYMQEFYNKLHIDEFTDLYVSAHLLDQSVNSGRSRGVKILQKSVNNLINDALVVDGLIGKNTIRVSNECNAEDLRKEIEKERKSFYQSIVDSKPSQAKFLKGWLNRVDNTTKYIDNILS